MALTREAQQERAAVIRYLREQIIVNPVDETEEHWSGSLNQIVRDVVAGKHVKAVRRG